LKSAIKHLIYTIGSNAFKETTMAGIADFIDNEVKNNEIVVFMKGTPDFPQCGFSGQVVQIMNYMGAPYKAINVLADDDLRQGIKEYSNWPTIPQLYIKGEFLGGCDIIREMFQSEELQQHLKDNGIAVTTPDQA
jgi:monothiol glutaredoxin